MSINSVDKEVARLILLGTGTSTGVPEVGCGCGLCHSQDPRDKRLRASAIYITEEGKRILIDCSPDFRQQALSIGLDCIDALLLTHEHYDHIGGLDDLRTIAWHKSLPVYGQPRVLESIKSRLHYIFSDNPYPGTARLELYPIEEGIESIEVCGVRVQPIQVSHGRLPILGYRIGEMSYVTDIKAIERDEWQRVSGSRVLVLGALRWLRPHPSHQSIKDALSLLQTLDHKPEQTLLTHLSHHAPSFGELESILPEGVSSAYDGEEVVFESSSLSLRPYRPLSEPYHYMDCGRIAYAEAWELQKQLFEGTLAAKAEGRPTECYLLLCEHNPVFTLGKHGEQSNVLVSQEFLQSNGYDYYQVERGGDITYHGPGQVTGYPILDLERYGMGLRAYIEMVEDIIIDVLSFYGLQGGRKEGATGVWLDPTDQHKARKICAIGVRSSRYVTMHGFALNVNTDLSAFTLINPCGFKEGRVTSLASELGHEVDFTAVKRLLSDRFYRRLSAYMYRA